MPWNKNQYLKNRKQIALNNTGIQAMIPCQQENTIHDKWKIQLIKKKYQSVKTDPEMTHRIKLVDKDIKSAIVNIQMILDLQWFNLQFFNFMMMQKQYTFSRNHTSNFEF